jgi:hypothetical protein
MRAPPSKAESGSAVLTADPAPETGTAWAVAGAGLDTVSFSWVDERLALRLAKRAGDPLRDPETGELVLLRPVKRGVITADRVSGGGWHFGAYPSAGMVFVEGRLAPMLSHDLADRTLVAASRLPEAVAVASARIGSLMSEPRGPVRVRRADLAADVAFRMPEQGLAALRGLARLDVPRYKLDVWRHDGAQVETIYLRTRGGRVRARIYDKARERGEEPGSLVRAEYQFQPEGAKRPTVPEFIVSDVSKLWRRAFGAWADSSSSLVAGSLNEVQGEVLRLAREEVVSGRVAERILGTISLLASGTGESVIGLRAVQRRRAELRSLGLSVEAGEEIEVPVGAMFAAIFAALAPA